MNARNDPPVEATPPPSSRPSSPPQGSPHRHSLPPSVERDKASMRIPSSASPSPMKIVPPAAQIETPPTNAGFIAPRSGESPVMISRQETRLLQETVTTLLGKRPSEEDPGGAQPGGAQPGGATTHNSRSAKRIRPPSRHKVSEPRQRRSLHDCFNVGVLMNDIIADCCGP